MNKRASRGHLSRVVPARGSVLPLSAAILLMFLPLTCSADIASELHEELLLTLAMEPLDISALESAVSRIESLAEDEGGLPEALVLAGIARVALGEISDGTNDFRRALCLDPSVQLSLEYDNEQASLTFQRAIEGHRKDAVRILVSEVTTDDGKGVQDFQLISKGHALCTSVPCTLWFCVGMKPELNLEAEGRVSVRVTVQEGLRKGLFYPKLEELVVGKILEDPEKPPVPVERPLSLDVVRHDLLIDRDGSTEYRFTLHVGGDGAGDLYTVMEGQGRRLHPRSGGRQEVVMLKSPDPTKSQILFVHFELDHEPPSGGPFVSTGEYRLSFEKRTRWHRWNVVSAPCYAVSGLLAAAGVARHMDASSAYESYDDSHNYYELQGLWEDVERHAEARDAYFIAAGICLVPALVTTFVDFGLAPAPKWPRGEAPVSVRTSPRDGLGLRLDISGLLFRDPSEEGGR